VAWCPDTAYWDRANACTGKATERSKQEPSLLRGCIQLGATGWVLIVLVLPVHCPKGRR
jgi:hypothetical protein